MPVQLPSISFGSVVAGATQSVSLKTMAISARPTNPQGPFATLRVFNDTQYAITATPDVTQDNFGIPAGAWHDITLAPGTSTVVLSVNYVIQSVTGPNIVLLYFYDVYEDPGPLPSIGNVPAIQARTIQVPMSVINNTGDWTGIATNGTLSITSFSVPAVLLSAKAAVIYLYWAYMSIIAPTAASNFEINFSIQGNFSNSSHVALFGWTDMARFVIGASQANKPDSQIAFFPPQAIHLGVSWTNQAVAFAEFRFVCNAYAGTAAQGITYNVACDLDTTNPVSIPGNIGNALYYGSTGLF